MKKIKKYGLDFGTTNSSIAIEENGVGKVLAIDFEALDPRVIRSMLYFFPRKLVYRESIDPKKIEAQVFDPGDILYQGEFRHLIGHKAIIQYLADNKFRKPGITRKMLTGRMVAPGAGADEIPEYYYEVDYGTGRLMQALKTALKSSLYQGSTIFGQHFSLEELISVFIKEIKHKADQDVGGDISEVVVGRPVHFLDDPQKDKIAQDRLEQSLKLSGFKNITFKFEPVGAAKQFLARSWSSQDDKQAVVFVFDFGGGTLDTAIVEKNEDEFRVLAADGVYIGGDLLNADILAAKLFPYFGSEALWGQHQIKVSSHIFDSLNSWYSIPSLNNPNTMNRLEEIKYINTDPGSIDRLIYLIKLNLGFDLYEAIEKAKKQLSSDQVANIFFKDGPIDINIKITRLEFEKIIKERVAEIEKVIFKTLITAKLEPSEIDVVVRTGGSSLIPVFENLLVKVFGKNKIKQFETFTSIASGLSLSQ